jgi:hypothetical protein
MKKGGEVMRVPTGQDARAGAATLFNSATSFRNPLSGTERSGFSIGEVMGLGTFEKRTAAVEPVEVGAGRVTWTYFDTAARQWQQRVYAVPDRRFKWSAHALVRASVVPEKRLWAGVGVPALQAPEGVCGRHCDAQA